MTSPPLSGHSTAPPQMPKRLSMSYLRSAGQCLRRAALDREADTAGEYAIVGRITHDIMATAGLLANLWQVEMLPRETLMAIAEETLRSPEGRVDPLSLTGYRRVLEIVDRIADSHRLPIDAQFEVLSHQELDGATLSARLDVLRVDALGRGTSGEIEDHKTGGELPSASAPAITVQLENYGWHGSRMHPHVLDWTLTTHYAPYGVRRTGYMTRDQFEDTEAFLRVEIARVRLAYEQAAEGRPLKPSPGSWCAMCSDPDGCPLPPWAKDAAALRTDEDAQAELDAILVHDVRQRARKKRMRAYLEAKELDVVSTGDMEIGFRSPSTGGDPKFGVRRAGRS